MYFFFIYVVFPFCIVATLGKTYEHLKLGLIIAKPNLVPIKCIQ